MKKIIDCEEDFLKKLEKIIDGMFPYGSVTRKINKIKQPRGGYLNINDFDVIQLDDGNELSEGFNVDARLVGLAADYLTRYMICIKPHKIKNEDDFIKSIEFKRDVFSISLGGLIRKLSIEKTNITESEEFYNFLKMLSNIQGLDDKSIINACKIVTYDSFFRGFYFHAIKSLQYNEINPNKETINNIRIMVERSINFYKEYGPVTQFGFGFVPKDFSGDDKEKQKLYEEKGSWGGYTYEVRSGDGDFLTADTLWDFKVLKNKPQSKHTLQLLMYWIMGQHSGQDIYKGITKLGIFNPRYNIIYRIDISKIDTEIIKIIERNVLCYPECRIETEKIDDGFCTCFQKHPSVRAGREDMNGYWYICCKCNKRLYDGYTEYLWKKK